MDTSHPAKKSKYRVVPITNGILAGLVSITAVCDDIHPSLSIVVGTIGGVLYIYSSALLRKLRIDDPLDACVVHGFVGIWGVLAVGIFSTEVGILYGDDGSQLGIQLLGVLVISLWSGGCGSILFLILKQFNVLRTSKEEELEGMDNVRCDGDAYRFSQTQEVVRNILLRFQEF